MAAELSTELRRVFYMRQTGNRTKGGFACQPACRATPFFSSLQVIPVNVLFTGRRITQKMPDAGLSENRYPCTLLTAALSPFS